MLAFADFLYATSVFEDAFPLFLLVWTTLRIESGCKEAIALVKCARAARRPEDRMLVESLLKESMWMLDNGWPQSDVIRSLLRLELSQLYQLHDSKEESSNLYDEGIEIILPQRSSLIETFNKARHALQNDVAVSWDNAESYNLSQDIVIHAFDLASSKHKRMQLQPEDMTTTLANNSYNLRDVLLAHIYLGHCHDRLVAASSIRHLRGCLKHAEGILTRSWCEDSYRGFLTKIDLYWPDISREAERAIFFDLVINWSPLHLCEYLDIEHENSFTGLSTLEIILTISFLVRNGTDLHSTVDLHHRGSVGSRVAGLIALSDEALLLSFLWSSVRLNRTSSYENVRQAGYSELWTNWMTEIYKMLKKGKWEDQIIFEPSPTLATSIVTSSTLSAMRRHSRTVHFSQSRESNSRSHSTISPVQQWINLTADEEDMEDISKAMDEFTVSGDLTAVSDIKLHSEVLDVNPVASQSSSLGEKMGIIRPPRFISMTENGVEVAVTRKRWYESTSCETQPRDGG
jgi:hypothetical protein